MITPPEPPRGTPHWPAYGSGKPPKSNLETWTTVVLVVGGVVLAIHVVQSYGPIGFILFAFVAGGIALIVLVVRALIRVGDKRPPPVMFAAPHPPMPQLPPAGWYSDGQGMLRWFDGRQWTEFRKPPE